MSTDTPKIQYQKEVEVRVRSYGETRCINPQKPKTKTMKDAKKYIAIWCMTCQTGCRRVEKMWSMKAVLLEPRGNLELGYRDTASSSHELPMESLGKVEPGSGKHRVSTRTFRRTQIAISASCRRRAGTVVPRAENFGDLITADHEILPM